MNKMKKTEEYECGYADGYDKGYHEGKMSALSQIEDHADMMVTLLNELREAKEYAEKEKNKSKIDLSKLKRSD